MVSQRETSGKHQRAWPPADEAHHREPRMATWICALTMGCGRMARVHLVGVAAACCPHDLLHVPRHGPPPSLGPGEEDKK